MKANGYSDAAIKTLWDILVPFSDYAFNKAHTAGVRPGVLLDGVPQGQLPGRVHGRAADLGRRRQGQVARSTSPSAGGWASRCCRRTSTSPTPTSRPSAPTSGSGSPRSATSAPTWSTRSSATRKAKGAFTDFSDFLRKVDAVACNKKTVESLIKAGAFDSLGHTRRGLMAVFHADAIDCVPGHQEGRGDRPVRPVRRRLRPAATGARRRVRGAPSRTASGTRWTCSRSSGRCSASTSPTTRCSAWSTCWPRTRTITIAALHAEQVGDGQQIVTLAGILSGVQRRVTKQGAPWATATLEDLEGAVEVLFFPQHLRAGGGQYIAEDAIVVVKGPGRPARGRRPAHRDGPDPAGPHRGGRGGRSWSPCRRPGARRRWWSGCRRCWRPIPGRPRCSCSWSTATAGRRCGSRTDPGGADAALMGDLKALLGPTCLAG